MSGLGDCSECGIAQKEMSMSGADVVLVSVLTLVGSLGGAGIANAIASMMKQRER